MHMSAVPSEWYDLRLQRSRLKLIHHPCCSTACRMSTASISSSLAASAAASLTPVQLHYSGSEYNCKHAAAAAVAYGPSILPSAGRPQHDKLHPSSIQHAEASPFWTGILQKACKASTTAPYTALCRLQSARQLPVVSRLLMIASDLAFRVRKSLQLCATLIVWTMQPEQTTDILPKLNCTATCLCHLCLPNSVATCLRPPGGSNDSRLPFQKVFVIIVRKN